MKSIIKILITTTIILLILFFWKEFPDLSLSKKINAEKVSSFFTAIGSLLTALTVFLLYKQIKEQIEDRKAASKPDLYPADQFFSLLQDRVMPKLTRDKKNETLNGLISIHNIGLGAAKEITVTWHFNKEILASLLDEKIGLKEFYTNYVDSDTFSFVLPNNQLETQLPLIYISSMAHYKPGWTQMIWEDLFLEISYKDIQDFKYSSKIFKAKVYVSSNFASFNFKRVDSIKLSEKSTMKSAMFENDSED